MKKLTKAEYEVRIAMIVAEYVNRREALQKKYAAKLKALIEEYEAGKPAGDTPEKMGR